MDRSDQGSRKRWFQRNWSIATTNRDELIEIAQNASERFSMRTWDEAAGDFEGNVR